MYNKKKILEICGTLRKYREETMMMIILNENEEPVSSHIVGIGDKHVCTFRINDILTHLYESGMKDFILCHNHVPSVLPVIVQSFSSSSYML